MPDEHESWLIIDTATDPAAASVRPDGRGIRIVRVFGEVDGRTRAMLVAGLERAGAGDPHRIVLDCSGMAFCDGGGLDAVMRTVAAGAERGTDIAVVGLRPRLAQLCALLWPGPQPIPYPSITAAVVPADAPTPKMCA